MSSEQPEMDLQGEPSPAEDDAPGTPTRYRVTLRRELVYTVEVTAPSGTDAQTLVETMIGAGDDSISVTDLGITETSVEPVGPDADQPAPVQVQLDA